MLDVEVIGEAARQLVEGGSRVGVMRQDDVGRQDVHARRDRPGVEVVAVDDARRVEDVPPDVVEVHVTGRGLEQDIGRLAQQPERARQDQRGDQERGDRVGAVPAGQRDDDRRDDHGGRPTQVAEHLEIRAAHVEAGALRVAQQKHRHAIRGKADERDGEHDTRGDLRRIGEAPHRLEHDVAGDAEQQDGVCHRSDDLEPQVAECPAERRRPPREPDREQREPDPDDVGQQVARIGEQRQAVRDHRPDDLDGKGNQAEDEDRDEAPACCPAAVTCACGISSRGGRSSSAAS